MEQYKWEYTMMTSESSQIVSNWKHSDFGKPKLTNNCKICLLG